MLEVDGAPGAGSDDPLVAVVRGASELVGRLGRTDLVARLDAAGCRLRDKRARLVVAGALKQGKSQLVNSLLATDACTVGDDEATAVVTAISHADHPQARIVTRGEDGGDVEVDIHLTQVHGVSPDTPLAHGRRVLRLEVGIPNHFLQEGLVVVDTPGFGSQANRHPAGTLGLLPSADAVLVVSDASRELVEPEVEFLRAVLRVCPVVACVVTKTDLVPQWRAVVEADARRLRDARIAVPVLPVSALLRSYAYEYGDEELNAESGFSALLKFIRERVMARAAVNSRIAAALEVGYALEQVGLALSSELAALREPQWQAQRVEELRQARAQAEELRKRSAQWQVILNDGMADLVADVDHDLRDRLRQVVREAEAVIDESDPAEAWTELTAWLDSTVAQAAGDSFVWVNERATWLAQSVAFHFAEAAEVLVPDIADHDISQALGAVHQPGGVDTAGDDAGGKLLTGLRGSYGGILMVGLVTTAMGMTLLNPISLGVGLILGTRAYRDNQATLLTRRRAEAKVAVRKYGDDVVFHLGKESRDRLRQVQRVLRDHFTTVADQVVRSLSESVLSVQDAAGVAAREREQRVADIEGILGQIKGIERNVVAQVPEYAQVRRA